MKINSNFKLRHIAGETIIINQGTPDADLTRIISLNASARFLWNEFSGQEFSVDEVSYLWLKPIIYRYSKPGKMQRLGLSH